MRSFTRFARLALAFALALALESAAFARTAHELAAVESAAGLENCQAPESHERGAPAPSGHGRACAACLPCHIAAAAVEPRFNVDIARPISFAAAPLPGRDADAPSASPRKAHSARAPPSLS